MFETICTECGQATTVPFKPTPGKPVYCRTCFSKHNTAPARPLNDQNLKFSFDPKHAWAKRGDNYKGRVEPKPESIFSR